MKEIFNTPILFLIFNRPDSTKRVFEEIRKIKPHTLFIAADGPKSDRPEDVKKCKLTREIVANIDWPCKVKILFQEKNLGCGLGPVTAINWFFENVSEGIILEDDCLPDQSFFPYCKEMLEHYRNEEDVAIISGTNVASIWPSKKSYFFSRYCNLWGWATWKRAWNMYDIDMKSWADKKNRKLVKKRISNFLMWRDKKWAYNKICAGRKDAWDYQWEYAILLCNKFSIVPQVNLIENIGFTIDATHTKSQGNFRFISHPLSFPLKYQNVVDYDEQYDNYLIKKIFNPKTFLQRVLNRIKKYGGISKK
jgi:hypothetical protein